MVTKKCHFGKPSNVKLICNFFEKHLRKVTKLDKKLHKIVERIESQIWNLIDQKNIKISILDARKRKINHYYESRINRKKMQLDKALQHRRNND